MSIHTNEFEVSDEPDQTVFNFKPNPWRSPEEEQIARQRAASAFHQYVRLVRYASKVLKNMRALHSDILRLQYLLFSEQVAEAENDIAIFKETIDAKQCEQECNDQFYYLARAVYYYIGIPGPLNASPENILEFLEKYYV